MTHEHMMWLLAFRAVGMGLAMMPIMTGGIAAVPPTHGQQRQRDQQRGAADHRRARPGHADRRPDHPAGPADGRPVRAARGRLGRRPACPRRAPGRRPGSPAPTRCTSRPAHRCSSSALDELFIITAVLTAVGVLLALMLRSGPAAGAGWSGCLGRGEAEPATPVRADTGAIGREPGPRRARRSGTGRTGQQRGRPCSRYVSHEPSGRSAAWSRWSARRGAKRPKHCRSWSGARSTGRR